MQEQAKVHGQNQGLKDLDTVFLFISQICGTYATDNMFVCCIHRENLSNGPERVQLLQLPHPPPPLLTLNLL